MSEGQLTATSTEDAGEHYVLIVFTSIVFRCLFLGICVEDGVSRTAEREGEHVGDNTLGKTPWEKTRENALGEKNLGRTPG